MNNKRFVVKACIIFMLVVIVGVIAINIRVVTHNGEKGLLLGGGVDLVFGDKGVDKKAEKLLGDSTIRVVSSKDSEITDLPIDKLGISYKLVDKNYKVLKKYPRVVNLQSSGVFYIKDTNKFRKYFEDFNKTAEKSHDAYLKRSKSDIKVCPEKIGTQIDVDALVKTYTDELKLSNKIIDMNNFVVHPHRKSEDYAIVSKTMKNLKKWGIFYTNGKKITYKNVLPFIRFNKKLKLKINERKLRDYLSANITSIVGSYNTVGKLRKFKAHNGKVYKLNTGTYGDVVNFTDEIDYIIKSLKIFKSSKNRVPCLDLDLPDDIPSTYVEVSLSNQHLWYYKKGKLKMQSDVVTGTLGKHDTPRGIYYVSEKIAGKYLTGDGYKTWVNYWMRLTNMGVGLHDATWRGNFGGSIYTYSGSHGCVNLPYSFAKRLFHALDRKTAVIIY